MTTPGESVLQKVLEWVSFADDDLRLAEHSLQMGVECPYRLVGYHAQQCAEKYLKAYLVLSGIDFPPTHNIARLVELCPEDLNRRVILREAAWLTTFSTTARYPGEGSQATADEARRAIRIASQVRQVVRDTMVREGVTL
jgi:HEPN domain-containing protein